MRFIKRVIIAPSEKPVIIRRKESEFLVQEGLDGPVGNVVASFDLLTGELLKIDGLGLGRVLFFSDQAQVRRLQAGHIRHVLVIYNVEAAPELSFVRKGQRRKREKSARGNDPQEALGSPTSW